MDAVAVAQQLADDLLFPRALETDAADAIPADILDALAKAALYGISSPTAFGGLDLELDEFVAVLEALSSGCLATAFVFAQHHAAARGVAFSENETVRERWGAALASGRVRAGIALGGSVPGPAQLRARESGDGWIFSGSSAWVSGWGFLDVLGMAARTDDDRIVWALVDAAPGEHLLATPHRLVALQATATVRLDVRELPVPAERVTGVVPFQPGPTPVEVLRIHATFAFGVVARCCRLLGPTVLDEELDRCRRALVEATPESVAGARGEAGLLAVRAASALAAAGGSRSLLLEEHAQRLWREALFALVYALRAETRAALLAQLAPGAKS